MAVDSTQVAPIVPVPVQTSSMQVVQNTVPDPLRKGVAIGAIATGGALLLLGVICQMFPQLGGNAAPALQYGPLLLGYGGVTIWDRQSLPTA